MITITIPIEISSINDVNIEELTLLLKEYAQTIIPKLSKPKKVNTNKYKFDDKTMAIIESLRLYTKIPVPIDEDGKGYMDKV